MNRPKLTPTLNKIFKDILRRYPELKSREDIRKRGIEDLHFLTTEILYSKWNGYDDCYGEFTQEIADIVQNNTKVLLMVARGHLKTTFGTIADSIRLILMDPNIKILVVSATDELSKKVIDSVKGHFENNETFRFLYSEFCWENINHATAWSRKYMNVPNMTRLGGEYTFMIASVEKEVTGLHFDVIKYDDIVAKENSQSALQRMKVIDYFKASISLVDTTPYNIQHIIGTPWHEKDLYSLRDINKWGDEAILRDFPVMIRTCWEDSEKTIPRFKKRFTRQALESIKSIQGLYMFSSLYEMNPIPDEDQVFMAEWYNEFTKESYNIRQSEICIALDPAISERKRACESSITVGVRPAGEPKILVWDQWGGRVGPDKLTEVVIQYCKTYYSINKYIKLGIEDAAFQKILIRNIEIELLKQGVHIEVVPLTSYRQDSKDVRIKGMIPLMARGDMLFSKGLEVLKEQMLTWRGRRGDLVDRLDSTAYLLEMFGFEEGAITNLDKIYEEEIQEFVDNKFWKDLMPQGMEDIIFNNKREVVVAEEVIKNLYEGTPY